MHELIQKIELLYIKLGFSISKNGLSLTASKTIVGQTFNQTFIFYEGGDEESAYYLIEKYEKEYKGNDVVIIVSSNVSDKEKEILKLFSEKIFKIYEWYNHLFSAKDVCKKIIHQNKNISFVDPIIVPFNINEVENYFSKEKNGNAEEVQIIILTGKAGYGKTTFAKYLSEKNAQSFLENNETPFPIFISLEDHRTERTWEDLLGSYSRKINKNELNPEAIEFILDEGKANIFVDGLDELAERGGEDSASQTLINLVNGVKKGRAKILVSARDVYIENFQNIISKENVKNKTIFINIDGVSPTEENIRLLLKTYDNKIIENVCELLNKDEYKSSISQSPIFIKSIATGLTQLENETTLFENKNPLELMCLAMDEINKREKSRQSIDLNVDDYYSVLGECALEAINSGLISIKEDSLYVPDGYSLIEIWVEEYLSGKYKSDSDKKKKKIAVMNSLLSHTAFKKNSKKELFFEHRFYRDVIASKKILEMIKKNSDKINVSPKKVGAEIIEFISDDLFKEKITINLNRNSDINNYRDCFIITSKNIRLLKEEKAKNTINHALLLDNFNNLNLSQTRIDKISFNKISFENSIFNDTHFFNCSFIDCDFSKSILNRTQFEKCVVDETISNTLKSRGIHGDYYVKIEHPSDMEIKKDPELEFIISVFKEFFEKFIGNTPQKHRRSVGQDVFTRGINHNKASFMKEHIIPTAKKYKIVEELDIVLTFNPEFQEDGDKLLFEDTITSRINEIIETLRKKVGRYFVK